MQRPISVRTALLAISGSVCAAVLFINAVQSNPGFFPNILASAENQLAASAAVTWRSKLYPANWQPASPNAQGQYLTDFSYAGYHKGEDPIPTNPPGATYNVTQAPYNADKTGAKNSTKAIQQAIDDAGAAGGGIVYLPKGVYKVSLQESSDSAVLKIRKNGVVLRGDGPSNTFIYNASTAMRNKAVILVGTLQDYTLANLRLGSAPLTNNVQLPSTVLRVDPAQSNKFEVGDWVVVRSDLTAALISDLGMTGKWNPGDFIWAAHLRQIVGINKNTGTIVIDIPTRYPLLARDNARIYKFYTPIQEVGIEKLSMGNIKNPSKGWAEQDWRKPGTGAYNVHSSALIRLASVTNVWISNVKSYAPKNNGGIHMLSNGIRVLPSARNITMINVGFHNSQYNGGGGNGYGINLQGGENLVQNAAIGNMRHNIATFGATAMGNVIYKTVLGKSKHYTETHGHFSTSNLFDNVTIGGGEKLISEDRTGFGDSEHGLSGSQNVFWNAKGKGQVVSQQYKWGYIIGTGAGIAATPNGQGSNAKTAPPDYIEGAGKGATLRPQSLYADQLALRLRAIAAATAAEALAQQQQSDAAATTDDTAETTPEAAPLEAEYTPENDQSTGETAEDMPVDTGEPTIVDDSSEDGE